MRTMTNANSSPIEIPKQSVESSLSVIICVEQMSSIMWRLHEGLSGGQCGSSSIVATKRTSLAWWMRTESFGVDNMAGGSRL
jgi:hypothetical protein